MINNLVIEANNFLDSNEYLELLKNLAEDVHLDSNQTGYLSSAIALVILGDVAEEKFQDALEDTLEFNETEISAIIPMVKEKIFRLFKSHVARAFTDSLVSSSAPAQSTALAPTQTSAAQPKSIVGGDKVKPIFQHLENPPRSVVERHPDNQNQKPITDVSHLLDDTIDERPKLQDHYND